MMELNNHGEFLVVDCVSNILYMGGKVGLVQVKINVSYLDLCVEEYLFAMSKLFAFKLQLHKSTSSNPNF